MSNSGRRHSSRHTRKDDCHGSRSSASTTSLPAPLRMPVRCAWPASPTGTRGSPSGASVPLFPTGGLRMGFLDKMKETASKAAEQAKHATNVGKEKIED